MVVHSSPIEDGPKPRDTGLFQGPKPLHGGPVAAHPLTGLAAFFLLGALRAVFGPVGFWDVPATAQDALFSFPAVEQGGAQAFVQRQHSRRNQRQISE